MLAAGLAGQGFPLLTELMGEFVVRGLALLVQRRIALAAIPADGGGVDQHPGRGVGELDEIDQLLGQQPAAVAELLLAPLAPAAGGDGFSRQVDDRIHVVEVVEPVQGIDQLDVVAEQIVGAAALAGQHQHLVRHLEVGHQAATDKARPARDQYFHIQTP